ncbi:MAG: inorganic pyrophosphatase [Bacteroidetes bacterium]|nr:MAG: inorganic pyrophosphatase [Bacteroidota bacterium]PTM10643.1 MAG: inorganic pyrophosphatase [Bacteroidota bacterium]
MSRFLWTVLLVMSLLSCNRAAEADAAVDYRTLPAEVGEYLNVVVEIPAGTNHKIEFDYATATFKNDQEEGKDRVINFLPYPGNYGFIPGTLLDKERGGDGDALDVLVIGESAPTGSVMLVRPLGAIVLRDRGEIDTKIIAIPADPALQVIQAKDFLTFALRYDAIRTILEDWFQNYKGRQAVEILRWEDDVFAREEVSRWRQQPEK